jgi:signal transduction histidine kinase
VPDTPQNSPTPAAYARLLSLAVHEFRTPASVVGGYLRMLQRDQETPLTERQRKLVDEAEKSCARLVGLIAELSEVSKLDGGTAPFKDEPFDLFALVPEVASTVHEADDREVRLRVRGEASGASITADKSRMTTAFSSIFRAVLREQAGPAVVLADCRFAQGEEGSRSAVIVVARDVDVQSAYDAPRGPFDDKRGGLGLALPIARRVFERYGGRLWSPAAATPDAEASARGAIIVSLPVQS